ncbi:hypothetical protein ACQP1W_27840 [Spirillospora sp. CA-255316]
MSRSLVVPFVVITAVVAVMVGALALLALPLRISYGAGSIRCGTILDSADCPAGMAMNRLRDTGVLVAALIAPALVLFAFRGEGRGWSLARLAWVCLLFFYWVVALLLGLLSLAAAVPA